MGLIDTLWAKNRIADLDDEIRNEMSVNAESVGLEMVLQEKAWILDRFGIGPPPDVSEPSEKVSGVTSPKPHLAGRLADQFRGLKLATSPEGLAAAATGKIYVAVNHGFRITDYLKPEARLPVTTTRIYRR